MGKYSTNLLIDERSKSKKQTPGGKLRRMCCFQAQGTPLTAQSGLPGLPTKAILIRKLEKEIEKYAV
jgi:hypothetical protein